MAKVNSSLVPDGVEFSGSESLSNLLRIGVFTEVPVQDAYRRIDADADGLRTIGNSIHGALLTANRGVRAVGELLAFSADEVSREALTDLGWLIHGLGGLQAALLDRYDMVKENLDSTASMHPAAS